MMQSRIRNFSIIAHIDHGKSTLADRFIQLCGGLAEREMGEQVLDSMDLERERGITIKAQTVALSYVARDGETYLLNLIDTPGHVDFSYEVSRSLAACEGALLVVDASQGVEAQTVANCYTAIEQGVEVIPVLNKIDLASADPDNAIQEIEDVIGIQAKQAIRVSAKTGENVPETLEAVIAQVPAPKGDAGAVLRALVIDSWFDNYVGVVMLVRMVDGTLKPKDRVLLMSTGAEHSCEQVGVFTPKATEREQLSAGEVGFVVAGVKELREAKIGDTITSATGRLPSAPGIQGNQAAGIRRALSGRVEPVRGAARRAGEAAPERCVVSLRAETSQALGFGFRCGFLGLLHMDIVQERLEREVRHAPHHDGAVGHLRGAAARRHGRAGLEPGAPSDPASIAEIREPVIATTVFVPHEYVGPVMTLCTQKRGHADEPALLGAACGAVVRPAAERGRDGLLRPPEVADARIRVARLRVQGIPRGRHGAARHPRQRRQGRCALDHGAPGVCAAPRARPGHAPAGAHPAADVRRRGAGGDRVAHHRARERQGAAQERHREVLRWRHHAQAQAAREAESRQAAHEAGRLGRDPAGGVPRGAADGGKMNFALFLLILLVVTGAVWLLDLAVLRKGRSAEAKQPWWIEYSISFFPVILIVFLLRSFLVEPFKIPSGSMIPTLLIGDFILVNKYAYGIRIPVVNRKVIEIGRPHRGDVMVFRYPVDPSLDYIKRVVGVPGDRLEYRGRRLYINGAPVPVRRVDDYLSKERMQFSQRYQEKLDSDRARDPRRGGCPGVHPADALVPVPG
jgi:GTP-binding protein LepA